MPQRRITPEAPAGESSHRFLGAITAITAVRKISQAFPTGTTSPRSASFSDPKQEDLKRFHPHVVRRVRALQLAKKDARIRLLLLMEEAGSSCAASAMQALVAALVLASTVLLVLVATVGWGSPDHPALALADLAVSVALLVELLARCALRVGLRCARDDLTRSLAVSATARLRLRIAEVPRGGADPTPGARSPPCPGSSRTRSPPAPT